MSLFALAHDHHVMLINQHHIINDGWSLVILQRDLAALYDAALHGRPSDLADTPLQFAEFALWQRRTLPKVIATALDHWQRRLAGFTPFDLPADRARPPRLSGDGRTHHFAVPAKLAEALSSAAVDNRHVLRRLARGVRAAAVALDRPGRHRRRHALRQSPGCSRRRPVGYVANTLPLRVDLAGEPTFASLMGRVASELLDADAHQEAPFDLIVNRMAVARDPSRNPIFQVASSYQTFSDGLTNLRLPGLTCRRHFRRHPHGEIRPDPDAYRDTGGTDGRDRIQHGSVRCVDDRAADQQFLHLADRVRSSATPLDRLDILPLPLARRTSRVRRMLRVINGPGRGHARGPVRAQRRLLRRLPAVVVGTQR